MGSNSLKGVRVAILATDGFEQSELFEPQQALHEAGAVTEIVSLKSGTIRGWNHTDWGRTVNVGKTVEQVEPDSYDALVLPGGVMSPDALRTQPKAVAFVKTFFDRDKPVGAICHGAWTIVEAGAAKGRKMTSWPSLKTDIANAGGQWLDEEVLVDGNLVTSRKPGDIQAFNRELIALFGAQIRKVA